MCYDSVSLFIYNIFYMNTENIDTNISDIKNINYTNDFDEWISFLAEKRVEIDSIIK